jgi:solute carrier family 38 (sodium-coupled neutral amino acid transporter), member 11
MPLLVGLFDSSASRRSLDNPSLPLNGIDLDGNSVVIGDHTFDLDELAAKRTAGGGMMDSIANMANSILGAGKFPKRFLFIDWFISSRYNW